MDGVNRNVKDERQQHGTTERPKITQDYGEVWHARFENARKKKDRSVWKHLENSFYGTAAMLRSVFWGGGAAETKEPEMKRANAVIDDLDQYFKPTLKSKELAKPDGEDGVKSD